MTMMRTPREARPTARFSLLAILLALLLTACAAPAAPAAPAAGEATEAAADAPTQTGPIQIGSKDFTEAILVAELYAQLLEQAGPTAPAGR